MAIPRWYHVRAQVTECRPFQCHGSMRVSSLRSLPSGERGRLRLRGAFLAGFPPRDVLVSVCMHGACVHVCASVHVCMCVQSASRYVMKLRPGLALPSSCQGRCSSLFKVYLCCGACYRCPLLSPGAPSAQSPPRPAPQAFTTRCPCPWLCTCAGQVSG